jgi:DNA-binding HxlR family transcriptional regulator
MPRPKKTEACPFGGDGIGGKWQFWVLHSLLEGPMRFGELRRLFPEVNRQMLTLQLRQLERNGFLRRRVYFRDGEPQKIVKVEYSLSDLARDMAPFLRHVEEWGKWYSEQLGSSYDWLVSLGGRWKLMIWHHLLSGPKLASELQRLLPDANLQTLHLQLGKLERMGVLRRMPSTRRSRKTQYVLTAMGEQSEPMLHEMFAWGKSCCERLGVDFAWPTE